MRSLEYFVVCKSVSIDAVGGEISLFHLTHNHLVRPVPTTISSLCAVASWIDQDRMPGDGDSNDLVEAQVKLNVISPGGAPVNTFRRTLRSKNRVEYAVFRVTSIPITEEGELIFELIVDDVSVARRAIFVMQKGSQNTPIS